MKIITESNILGIEKNHSWAEHFTVLRYQDGATSVIPKAFFRNWLDQDINGGSFGTFYIGRGSGAGVGSIVKYDGNSQSLRMGRYVAGGLHLKFLLNGQHEMGTISTSMWHTYGIGLHNPPPPQYTDTVLRSKGSDPNTVHLTINTP